MKNAKAFHKMVVKAIERGRPNCYKDDLLTHDRISLGLLYPGEKPKDICPSLQIKEGESFGWILRELGTELLRFFSDDPNVRINEDQTAYYWGTSGAKQDSPHNWFFWDADAEVLVEFANYSGMKSYITSKRAGHKCTDIATTTE